jgi:hypothetical protein
MTTQLPANPNITHLKKQAKALRRSVAAGEPEALSRVAAHHPAGAPDPVTFTLRDAQLTIAREHGFDGWHQLNTAVGERMVEERDLHRWFGVALNNGIWDKLEDESVGPDMAPEERERLLYSAYASAYHWMNVGTAANHARGEHLIARTALKVGYAEEGLRHARRCLELVEQHPDVMEDWDVAFAHEALARALAATADVGAAESHLATAIELTEALGEGEDRRILETELARPPWFGLR